MTTLFKEDVDKMEKVQGKIIRTSGAENCKIIRTSGAELKEWDWVFKSAYK